MKIDRVILSTTKDPVYKSGISYVEKAWKKMGLEVSIHEVNEYVIRKYFGDEIHMQNLGKLYRMIATQFYRKEWCLISDADMMPMDFDFFRRNSEKAKEDSILYLTSELTGEDKGKFPACYMLAKGDVFQRYFNPDNLSLFDLVESFRGLSRNADPYKLPFSDESLYWHKFKDAPKVLVGRHHQDRRLCRSDWPNKLTKKMIEKEKYIDCHMPRPVKDNLDKLKPVFEYLEI